MKKPFFETPLTDEELDKAVEAPLDVAVAEVNKQEAEKWRHEATNAVAIQRLITETIDKIRDLENQETLARERGDEEPGEHDKIVAELKNLHYQWDTAKVIEENILHKLESTGKNIDDANYEMASVPEDKIEATKDELLVMISDIGKERAAQEAVREKIAKLDEPFRDVEKAA